MSDTNQKKTLTIKRRIVTDASPDKTADESSRTSDETPIVKKPIAAKRIITRAELVAKKVTSAVAPSGKRPVKSKQDRRKLPPKRNPKKPLVKPSDIRTDSLDAALNNFSVWREYVPLAIGIEKQVFQLIARLELSSSKRVVMRLLARHTHDKHYLQRLFAGGGRYNLDGTKAGEILPMEQKHAADKLAVMVRL